MNCPECHEDLKDNARFCSNCGVSFASLNTPTERADVFGENEKDAEEGHTEASALADELPVALKSPPSPPTMAASTTPPPQRTGPSLLADQRIINEETRSAQARVTPPVGNVLTDPISPPKLDREREIYVSGRGRGLMLGLGVTTLLVILIGGIVWLTRTTDDKKQASAINSAAGEMVLIPAGTFTMGSPELEAERSRQEGPQHQVSVPAFYMGKYEVTQAHWQQVMGNNPSDFKGENLPVEKVSWNDAQEFIRKLNAMNDGYVYRLPTEAEWEYACRAGTTTEFAFGSSLSSQQANFDGNYPYGGASKGVYRQKTTPVGAFQPNAFGLYDMHGNVFEWCEDWSHESYDGAPADGSAWLSGGEQKYRVLRGGSWAYYASRLRSANRTWLEPDLRYYYGGFRVVASARTP